MKFDLLFVLKVCVCVCVCVYATGEKKKKNWGGGVGYFPLLFSLPWLVQDASHVCTSIQKTTTKHTHTHTQPGPLLSFFYVYVKKIKLTTRIVLISRTVNKQ